ncbi:MAG: flagellar hook assembly protein FlgD [Alphaproteobacteria bacterium]|nr:flagellar hook assembly protein FlgD [Alphaproteobacteria bacterium]
MEVASATSTTSQTAADLAGAKLADNFDTFLQLLTTQLQNQDPLDPQDSAEFVNQLVQFSEVEQSIASNKSLEQLLDLQTTTQGTAALNYIGQTVEASGATAPLQGNRAQFSYTLPDNTETTNLIISDENGSVVFSTSGETDTGQHDFVWDGNDSNGTQLPEGAYTLTVSAQNSDGDPVTATTSVSGLVTGVETGDAGALLSLGLVKIPLTNVISVQQQEES